MEKLKSQFPFAALSVVDITPGILMQLKPKEVQLVKGKVEKSEHY